jgi:acyl carrier protein
MEHPLVKEAVTFAIPSKRLGEEVAAAVVLKDTDIKQNVLKHYLASKLAYFKIPSQIMVVDKIPKGPTGKTQRSGLAEEFGLSSIEGNKTQHAVIAPQTRTETEIAGLWEKILNQKNVGVNQTFISLGGDSILFGSLVIHLQEKYKIKLSLIDLFESPTVREQALYVEKVMQNEPNNTRYSSKPTI